GTVITQSAPVLKQMLLFPKVTVLCTGGELLAERPVVCGPRATKKAKEISSDLLLLGANAVDTAGVYLMGDRELLIERAFIDGSSKVVLLVDSSKLTRSAPVRLAGLEEIDVLVTTGPVPKDLLAACTERGVELIVAEESA